MSVSNSYSLDTNVLFYSLDPEAGSKHAIARAVVTSAARAKCPLVLQTLGELCNSVRRKRPGAIMQADRFALRSAELFQVVQGSPADLSDAIAANQDHKIPFWDAMLWAAARRAGCSLLLSEDFHDGQVLGGVTIRNPFKMSPSELAVYTS
jgi:predicted nucleic acid-binding protein